MRHEQQSADRRAVLEGVAYGDDPKITPGDRLRAIEYLAVLDANQVPEIRVLVGQLGDGELAHEWDHYCGPQLVRAVLEP